MKTNWLLIAAATILCGCPKPPVCNPDEEICDTDAGPPPDVCNSKEEALSSADCEILVSTSPDAGVPKLGYLSIPMDQDWYRAKLPTLTPRSLVHITAGYSAPSTAVNLAVSVLKEDGVTGITRKVDKHGAGAPRPVDIIFPYSESATNLLIVLADEAASNKAIFDVRNQYSVAVDVFENPDLNEPNDTVPTVIPLTAAGAALTGQSKGALATDNDVDKYKFTVPSGRKIIYLHITAPKLTPQALARVTYTLFDPAMKSIAEGTALNEFVPVDLATARLSPMGGDYTLEVKGYKPPSSTTATQGDLRLLYTVDVQVLEDLDVNEPNDTVAAPKVVPLAYGGSTSLIGRLSYVPDPDVFGLDLAPNGGSGVLHYKLSVNMAAGRFAPLAPVSDRQMRVVTQITTGATVGDKRVQCKTNSTLCPKGYEGNAQNQSLVEALCDAQDPPWCLWMERNEDVDFTNLRNMEGTIPVPAHAGTARYFLFVQDEGNDYADDREYTLNVSYDSDADDTARAALPFETTTSSLSENASYPVPAGGGVSGVLSHGYGRVVNNRVENGQGVRASGDYDAVPTDFDRFEFTLPAVAPPPDRSWALQWEIGHNDAGTPPSDLALEVGFCTAATQADGGCGAVTRVLAFSPDTISPWYSSAQMSRGILWTRVVGTNSTVVTAQPLGCFCMEGRFMTSGHFTVRVGAVDRNRYDPTYYTLRQSLAPYPPPAFVVDGGSVSCPSAAADGGSCKFAGN